MSSPNNSTSVNISGWNANTLLQTVKKHHTGVIDIAKQQYELKGKAEDPKS